ncbi:MAG: hypothetical protein JNL49_05970 [Bacteroidia bacterium]|nr:hypothetical protein [Bacteroidia bacterium]
MKRDLKYWVSWIGVLPISIAVGIIITFPIHWILYQTLSGGNDPFITPYPELPERILLPFFTSLAIVWVGAKIAPEKKFITAIILSIAWMVFAGLFFIMAVFEIQFDKFQYYLLEGGLPLVMGIAGSITGLSQVSNKLKEEKQQFKLRKDDTQENKLYFYLEKVDLMNLIFIGLFIACFYNNIVRNVFFIFLLCFSIFLILFLLREKMYTTRIMLFNLSINIITVTVLLIGLLNSTLAFQATVFCFGIHIFHFIRQFITSHIIIKKNDSANSISPAKELTRNIYKKFIHLDSNLEDIDKLKVLLMDRYPEGSELHDLAISNKDFLTDLQSVLLTIINMEFPECRAIEPLALQYYEALEELCQLGHEESIKEMKNLRKIMKQARDNGLDEVSGLYVSMKSGLLHKRGNFQSTLSQLKW